MLLISLDVILTFSYRLIQIIIFLRFAKGIFIRVIMRNIENITNQIPFTRIFKAFKNPCVIYAISIVCQCWLKQTLWTSLDSNAMCHFILTRVADIGKFSMDDASRSSDNTVTHFFFLWPLKVRNIRTSKIQPTIIRRALIPCFEVWRGESLFL